MVRPFPSGGRRTVGDTSISLAGSFRLWQKGNGTCSGLSPQTEHEARDELTLSRAFHFLWHVYELAATAILLLDAISRCVFSLRSTVGDCGSLLAQLSWGQVFGSNPGVRLGRGATIVGNASGIRTKSCNRNLANGGIRKQEKPCGAGRTR
jgi:hypothetical protein